MPEVYSFPEGQVHIWTGIANASGSAIAFVEDSLWTPEIRYASYRCASGNWVDLAIDTRLDANVTVLYSGGQAFADILAATGTPVHIKFTHSAFGNSAGCIAYSGKIHQIQYRGAQGDVFRYSLTYQAHNFSAF